MKHKIIHIRRNYFSLFCFVLGLSLTLIMLLNNSYAREETSLIQYILHILIFLIILLGISFFPSRYKFNYILMFASIVVIFGYISPKMSYAAIFKHLDVYYKYENVFLFPIVVLSICFAYRIGGGSVGKCIKTGVSSVILLFSGFVDLMWFLANNVNYATYPVSIPHIEVILGFTPNFIQLIIFIFIHIIFMVIIYILPLDRWINNIFKIQKNI